MSDISCASKKLSAFLTFSIQSVVGGAGIWRLVQQSKITKVSNSPEILDLGGGLIKCVSLTCFLPIQKSLGMRLYIVTNPRVLTVTTLPVNIKPHWVYQDKFPVLRLCSLFAL